MTKLVMVLAATVFLAACSMNPLEQTSPICYSASSSNSEVSNTDFVILADGRPSTITWEVDCRFLVWNGEVYIDYVSFAEGLWSVKFCSGPNPWMGFSLSAMALKDMSAYSNGVLVFSVRGTKSAFRFGVKSQGQDAWISASELSTYGYVPDNEWHEVKVPMTVFKAKNPAFDLAKVENYFQFSSDTGYAVGDFYYLDNVYWKLN